MARTNNLTNFLTDVADAIKEKKGDSTAIPAADFDTEIINLPTGGAEDVEDFPIYETWVNTAKQILGISSPYTKLEYIESTGTQYIDTDFTPNSDTKIELDFALSSLNRNQGFVSAYDVWTDRSYLLYFHDYLTWTYGRPVFVTQTKDTNRHTLSLYKGVVIYDDVTVQNITSDTYQNVNKPIRLFASWASGHNGSMKLYGFKIYDTNVLTHNFIPAKRILDNEIGLYDITTDTFYTNDGTGDFVAGPEEGELLPYTELEYIQSTGTQWIDTGVLPTVDTKSIIDFQSTGDNTIGTVFGVRERWTSRGYWVGADSDRLGNKYWQQIGSSYTLTNTYSDTNRHTIDFSKTGLYLDDTLISTISPSSFVAYGNLPLFRSVDGSSISYMCQKLYSFKVYESNTLIRDFIPVKRVSDDTVCMYDRVYGEFFTNQGTGDFVAGPEK